MLWLSEVLIQNPDLENFDQLKEVLKEKAAGGELFFRMDAVSYTHLRAHET